MMDSPAFKSPHEEARYWKLRAEEYKRIGEDARTELEEYQESSREVEAELEAQLKQAESQVRELRTAQHRLQVEHNSLKEKYEALSRDHCAQVADLSARVAGLEKAGEETAQKVRQLEQTNDDLERANRAALGTLEDFETRLHQSFERNAFLESELDDKELLVVTVQRLKDEAKELKQELQVRQRAIHETPDNEKVAATKLKVVVVEEMEKRDPTKSPCSPVDSNKMPSSTVHNDNGISQAARHSALNIVGDLLRRVGALENKLSTCRTMVKESNGANKDATRGGKILTRTPTATSGVQNIIRA